MTQQVAGFPYWEVAFNENGQPIQPEQAETLLADVLAQDITDLFIFAHGWNNAPSVARDLYARFFAEMRALLDDSRVARWRPATIGVVGIIWPSMRWIDEPLVVADTGGAASFGPADDQSAVDPVLELKAVFTQPEQQQALDELARLLQEQPDDPQALEQFQDLMRTLTHAPDAAEAAEDQGEQALLHEEARAVFERFEAEAPQPASEGGVAGLRDAVAGIWAGAREALRQATYWQMKKRGGIVGKEGVGPLIGRLHAARPELRIHLIGHSFGARLVSFALAGLPDPVGTAGAASPIKSLVLLQGAFSHFTFADSLPHNPRQPGALAGLARRVDGPLVVSHSEKDLAVGKYYPLASFASGDDSAAFEDQLYRWGAMGHDGAQAVQAAAFPLLPVGQAYSFTAGKFVNLDGNDIIIAGEPPSGAHSDIFHPELAWAVLAASGMARTA